jgi:hypothetical protein
MSPTLKDYYHTKQRRMAFYIAENDLNNEENPPEISAVIGLDKELEAAFYAARRPTLTGKPGMSAGIRVNRDITSNDKTKKEEKENEKKKKIVNKRNGFHCPSLPTQWINNSDIIIPRAEFNNF